MFSRFPGNRAIEVVVVVVVVCVLYVLDWRCQANNARLRRRPGAGISAWLYSLRSYQLIQPASFHSLLYKFTVCIFCINRHWMDTPLAGLPSVRLLVPYEFAAAVRFREWLLINSSIPRITKFTFKSFVLFSISVLVLFRPKHIIQHPYATTSVCPNIDPSYYRWKR